MVAGVWGWNDFACVRVYSTINWNFLLTNSLLLKLTAHKRDSRETRIIEGNAKCHHIKQFIYKGTLQVFICLRPRTPYPPPPPTSYTLYTCVQHTYSHREGEGGIVEPERRLEGQQFTKLGRKYQHDWL
jgi:hypothetical protein